jgi:fructokinase
MTPVMPLFGCIEAGGTKFVIGIASAPDDIRETAVVETSSPDATIRETISWFRSAASKHGSLAALGIASFGPAELDHEAPNWGHITATTKPGWSHTDFAGRIGRELDLPVGFDTDVNGAALAEARWGASRGHKISVYVTVGTGIGGGAIVNGMPLHGMSHPEMGHMRLPRHPDDQGFAGVCPFHGDCLEGLASGPAIKARWGASLSDLAGDHPGHAIIGWYLAQCAVTLQAIMEPGRIVMGGGVMATPGLLERVRAEATRLAGGYFRGTAEQVIVLPGLGNRAGLLGGLCLAMDCLAAF